MEHLRLGTLGNAAFREYPEGPSQDHRITGSQERLLDHDPLEASWRRVVEVLEDCVEDGTLVHVEHGEDGALDAEDGRVEVSAVAVEVELHVVVGEAQHVPLLDNKGSDRRKME